MAAHMIALLYTDDFSWTAEYAANVPGIVAKFGGRYNFVSDGPVEVAEGDIAAPAGVGIFDFPSREAIRDFLNSAEYAPYVELRNRFSRTQILVFDGRSA